MLVLGKHSHCTYREREREGGTRTQSAVKWSIRMPNAVSRKAAPEQKKQLETKRINGGYTHTDKPFSQVGQRGQSRGVCGRGNHAWHCDRVLPAVSRTLALLTCSQKTQLSNPPPLYLPYTSSPLSPLHSPCLTQIAECI